MTAVLRETDSARALFQRVHGAGDLAAECPLVFGPGAVGEVVCLEHEGALRAACTLVVREFRIGARRIRGGMIGSVATDPAWRGRGLATRLLARAEETLRARGAMFAMLWATDPGFYLKRGYVPFGVENDFLIGTELAGALPEPSGVRALAADDAEHVHRLYGTHATRVERSPAETRLLLGAPDMVTLVLERPSAPGQPALPQAYACLGRGRDLADTIHEWGGAAEDVLALVRGHLARRFLPGERGTLFLMAPPVESELAYRLVQLGASSRRGILGLGKVVAPAAAVDALARELGAPGAATLVGDDGVRLTGPKGSLTFDFEALQALLFGGPELRDEVRGLLERLGFGEVALPLQPFAWGLDSI